MNRRQQLAKRRRDLAEAARVEQKAGWPTGTLSNEAGWPEIPKLLSPRELAKRDAEYAKQRREQEAREQEAQRERAYRFAKALAFHLKEEPSAEVGLELLDALAQADWYAYPDEERYDW